MRKFWVRFLRPGIGRRIAIAMVLSLVAVQLQVFAQMRFFARFEVRMTGTRWLAETTAEAARSAFAVPPAQRAAALAVLARGLPAKLAWTEKRPDWAEGRPSLITARLAATIKEALGGRARTVEAILAPFDYVFPVRTLRVGLIPGSVEGELGATPLRPGEPDALLPASVRVAVQGPDLSWVEVAPESLAVSGIIWHTPIVPLAAGGLIIALISAMTARRIMAPLNRLVLAAERVGASREMVAVADEKLGEFAPVAQAFEDMQRRLLRLVDDRTQMLAAISHDLRSSLTRLRISAEACKDEAASQAIVTEIEDMHAMVESTLAFASGEARMTPNCPTDLAALLISLVDEATDSGRSCDYIGPDHAELVAHPVALKRAFSNLIDNALKYGGLARVRLEQSHGCLHIRVEDDGPGIKPHLVEDAFSPFHRLDPSRNNEISGVGLGLTIARDVVRSHGGTIALACGETRGLIVSVELPANARG